MDLETIDIPFVGSAAETLWNNIRDYVEHAHYCVKLHELAGEERRLAEVHAVFFLLTATWGYNSSSDAEYGHRINRLHFLSKHCSSTYKVTTTSFKQRLVIHLPGQDKPIFVPIGHVSGFIALLPLTEGGYRDYMLNAVKMSSMKELHIVEDSITKPIRLHSVDFIMITGVVNVASLPTYLMGDLRYNNLGYREVAALLRHISNLLPDIEIKTDSSGYLHCSRRDGKGILPVVICPLSGKGMGNNLLETAGFQNMQAFDKSGIQNVWALDIGDFDGKRVSDDSEINEEETYPHLVGRTRYACIRKSIDILSKLQKSSP